MHKLTFHGDHYQLGFRLGEESKAIFTHYIKSSEDFTKLLQWRNSSWLRDTAELVAQKLPELYQELQGIADGCEQDVMDILLWNCRGDLISTEPEGCTSIGVCHQQHALLAHNEDGDPNLRQACFLLDATLDTGTRFITFAYPASIPGHTLSANSHGLAYTVNNIRLTEKQVGIPRMVISRNLLEARNVNDFIARLNAHPRSGGFHYTVADTQTRVPMSIEAPFHGVSAVEADAICVHANHLVHNQFQETAQRITHSSLCRQQRFEELIAPYQGKVSLVDEARCLKFLQDTEAELPIYRMSEDDPDDENTLATVCFTLTKQGINVNIYDPLTFHKEVTLSIDCLS